MRITLSYYVFVLSESLQLVHKMVDQVIELHPNIQSFHIGADEVSSHAVCTIRYGVGVANIYLPATVSNRLFRDIAEL